MVRLLYISGMVFFAVLIGDTSHRLHEQYKAGTLFDQYNSERKAAITLLSVSSFGLAALCLVELIRVRRRIEEHGFGPVEKAEEEPEVERTESTSIYAAPSSVDAWQGPQRRVVLSKSTRRKSYLSLEINALWMSVLRIYCGVLPVVYTYILLNYLFVWLPSGAGNLVLSVLFPLLFLGSVLTSVGILRKKTWGIKFGYASAIFHLLIFPVGTAAGFVMLIALMGASSEFAPARRRVRRTSGKIKRKKPSSAAV
jgi:hypothetical protein